MSVTADAARMAVVVDGARCDLTPRQWAFFAALLDAQGRVVTHAELMRAMGFKVATASDSDRDFCHVMVSRLRARGIPLETRTGIGYVLPAGEHEHVCGGCGAALAEVAS